MLRPVTGVMQATPEGVQLAEGMMTLAGRGVGTGTQLPKLWGGGLGQYVGIMTFIGEG